MRRWLMTSSLMFLLFLPSSMPERFSAISAANAQSQDALVLKCRKAVFRKYGQRRIQADGRKVRSLPKNFVLRAVDSCVANGGRVL